MMMQVNRVHHQLGFTLIEIVFALGLLGLAMSALFPGFLSHTKYNNFSEVRTSAYQAAQIVLDELRLEEPSVLPSSGSDPAVNVTVGTRSFSVVASFCEDNTYCGANIRHITVRVTYQNEEIYEVNTVYTQLR